EVLRPRHEGAPPLQPALLPEAGTEGRMNAAVATAATARPPLWRRLLGFNVLTGIVLGIVGFYLGWWLGHQIHAPSLAFFADTGQNDIALMFGYIGFTI